MNKMVEKLIERVADWPEDAQVELMQSVADIEARHFGVYRLTDEERAAVREGLAEADRGEFVPDEAVEAFFKKHGA